MRRYKLVIIATAIFLLLCLAACRANSPYKERSSLVISDKSVYRVDMTAEVTGRDKIRLNFENNSDKTCMYGQSYSLEYYYHENWYKVPFKKDAGIFTHEGILLGPAEEYAQKGSEDIILVNKNTMDVELSNMMGVLPNGHYRIVKSFTVMDENGSTDETFNLAAEFDLVWA